MATPARRRPTIEDVATQAGVSRATVSRVLNGGVWVSPDAHARVTRAIAKTGYRINPHARGLATSRAGSVALLLTESHDRFFADPNFARIMEVLAAELATHDLPLVLLLAGTEAEQKRAATFLTGGHVDGALVLSVHQGRQGFLTDLIDADVPLIVGGIPLGFEHRVASVQVEDYASAREMCEYLASTGRTAIGHIAGPQDTSSGIERLKAFRDVAGAEAPVEVGDYSTESGAAGMRALLDSGTPLDAVFCANDAMAVGALGVAAERGLTVPNDLAVAGFDDSPFATAATPPLTTIRQPFERIGEEMVRLLLERIAGTSPSRVNLPGELVRRESA